MEEFQQVFGEGENQADAGGHAGAAAEAILRRPDANEEPRQ